MSLKTGPFSAAGTTLGYKFGSSSVFTTLLQLITLEAPATDVAAIDTTALSATVKTSIPSIPDNGSVSFDVFYVPGDSGVAELTSLAASPAVGLWLITLPDGSVAGTTIGFSAFLTQFAPKGFAIDDKPVASVTLKVTGLVTVTPGS